MKKQLFLLITLSLAFGMASADEVTIGSLDWSENHSFLPMNTSYYFSYTQQIYTAEGIRRMGTINSITVWLNGKADLEAMQFDIYMLEVEKAAFSGAGPSDWVVVSESDKVYSGTVTVHNTETQAYTFTLDTPFSYCGNGNLLIAFNKCTRTHYGNMGGRVFGAVTDPKRALYSGSFDPDPFNPYEPTFGANGNTYYRNVITLGFSSSVPIPYWEVTTTANPFEGGSISGGGTYREGEMCTLTAHPAAR